jgi:anaerobic selenocysteine-containing dehydrogenase
MGTSTDTRPTDPTDAAAGEGWHATACILCSVNCGIEVKLDGRHFTRIRGDKAHPTSQGYTCEKALRLDHYQSSRDRLSSPLRRRPDGTFEEIDWDTAIAEIAGRKKDADGALRMSPDDAARLGVEPGGRVCVVTKRGSVDTVVEVTDAMQAGHVSLPNGLGLDYPESGGTVEGGRVMTGAATNELTSSDDRDWFAGTPWHKHVRARVEVIEATAPQEAVPASSGLDGRCRTRRRLRRRPMESA